MSESSTTVYANALDAKRAQEKSISQKRTVYRTDVGIPVWRIHRIHDSGNGDRHMGDMVWRSNNRVCPLPTRSVQ